MSIIACIGWGSLVWAPARTAGQPLDSEGVLAGMEGDGGSWRPDGPRLPIELARISGREKPLAERYVSLVIVEAGNVPDVTTLWAPLMVPAGSDIAYAAARLGQREGVSDADRSIGRYQARRGASARRYAGSEAIEEWALAKDIDAVVWTALGPNWGGVDGRVPSEPEVLAFLQSQTAISAHAPSERYIRNAPPQISTPFRTATERALGWLPAPNGGGTKGGER